LLEFLCMAAKTFGVLHRYRMPFLFLASFFYLVAAALMISRGVHHFELFCLSLQFAILLPAIYLALQTGDGEAAVARNAKPQYLWFAILAFVLVCLGFSYYVGQGSYADEAAYKFQAEVFASLRVAADPPPGTSGIASQVPLPLAFKHLIITKSGWFSKYPIGWPLILAIGEKVNLGWAATPILGGLLLIVIVFATREVFGENAVFPAVWLAVLSPYVLAHSTGRMSHALCALLIAIAVLLYLRGIRTDRLSPFALMFVLLIVSYHVRPFTAFLVTAVLGSGLVLHYFGNRSMLGRLLALSVLAGVVAVGSVLLYNHVYTGQWLLSPYELYEPTVFKLTPKEILRNVFYARRFSIQSTALYTFPFVFFLAAYGFWVNRSSPAVRILASIFPTIVIAYFAWTYTGSPIAGERFYYEGYFSVVILAAGGLPALLAKWKTSSHAISKAIAALTLLQIGMTLIAANEIAKRYKPYRRVQQAALEASNCHCAVFLESDGDLYIFDSSYLNLNTPAWKSSNVFYLNDPAPKERRYWARLFGWHDWRVMHYDVPKQRVVSQSYHSAP
jgi:hypothetical protein